MADGDVAVTSIDDRTAPVGAPTATMDNTDSIATAAAVLGPTGDIAALPDGAAPHNTLTRLKVMILVNATGIGELRELMRDNVTSI